MKVVIQRVRNAAVSVREEKAGSISKGLMVLVGIKRGDTNEDMEWMANKILKMRIFEDDEGKMNRSVSDIKGDILLVPNFTLYADASKGNRPGFGKAEAPGKAQKRYHYFVEKMKEKTNLKIETGEFGAEMAVQLTNDGPVTIVLKS